MLARSPFSIRRTPGIVLTVFVVMVFSASRVQAQCGNYVYISTEVAAPSGPVPLHKLPCSGPNCSRKPAVPLPPVSVTVGDPESNQLFGVQPYDFLPRDGRDRLFQDSALTYADPILTSIFHPPRSN